MISQHAHLTTTETLLSITQLKQQRRNAALYFLLPTIVYSNQGCPSLFCLPICGPKDEDTSQRN